MMKQKGTVYVKDGLPVEIAISRTSTYLEVLEKASEALSAGPTDQFSLLTSGGAIIKKESDWTIGCYLKRLHRSTVKLGIAKVIVTILINAPNNVYRYHGGLLPH